MHLANQLQIDRVTLFEHRRDTGVNRTLCIQRFTNWFGDFGIFDDTRFNRCDIFVPRIGIFDVAGKLRLTTDKRTDENLAIRQRLGGAVEPAQVLSTTLICLSNRVGSDSSGGKGEGEKVTTPCRFCTKTPGI